MINCMYRINVYFNEGTSRDGKRYKVPHTLDLGFDCTVQLNGCKKTQFQWDEEFETYYIIYDARKAGLKANDKGYMTLHITD